jgi:hypothetical protein
LFERGFLEYWRAIPFGHQQGVRPMKKIAMVGASMVLAIALGIAMSIPSASAATGKKADCGQVMQELNSGKKPKEVAKDMSISVSTVYRCRKREKAAQTAAAKAGNRPNASPAASPATAPSTKKP